MNITAHRTLYFWITGLVLTAALGAIFVYGLPRAIDFTGGSLLKVSYQGARPELSVIQEQIAIVPLGAVSVRTFGADAISVRSRTMTPAEHDMVLAALSQNGTKITELSFNSIGPALGDQFETKALWAIFAVSFAIALYIAIAFRKVSRPVPSWGYGLIVVAILIHDLIIPSGFFAILAHATGAEVDALFITALLALLGYSVNDTIVIFDRIREHLSRNERENNKESFEQTVGKSISETMTRSLNTSLTVMLALLALLLFGASATRDFALVMLVGVIAGTYSSILLAAPLLIPLARRFTRVP
ncbi:MAG: preprotein translocase subunit SecF [Parcubacteria group bacterium Gr01-1014_49]|nr:MAG: preprotein translocase subunit SecF [Parcubacteria group bacterium Gr01-1014_49]